MATELTLEKLLKFDLLDEAEKCLMNNQNSRLGDYFGVVLEIQGTDQFIKDSPSFPGSTEKIVRNELLSAIGATLAIEGTSLSSDEIEESFRKADMNETLRRKEREADNSRKVYRFVLDVVDKGREGFQYTEQLIKQIHKYFTDNMDYPANTPGDYRGDYPVTFGVPRRPSLCRTRAEVELAMSYFVNWLNEKRSGIMTGDTIAKAIMSHYYLTEIHAFGDGNGRAARALEALVLYLHAINPYCFWSLANFWNAHRDQYLAHLGNIRRTCNAWDFIIWGMKGYLEEIKRIKHLVLTKVKQLMLMDYARYLHANKRNQRIKLNTRVLNVLDLLVGRQRVSQPKFMSSPEIMALYSTVSPATKSRDFKKLQNLGLIRVEREGDQRYIEANFRLLDSLTYYVAN
jgi:Fic family protein